jgi:5S rRNA maturation endonuclease (ribonuclease M5)
MTQVDTLRSSRENLERELLEAGSRIKGNSCVCPFHEDKHPSASLYRGEDGAWRLKCHTPACGFCGDIFDVRARLQGRLVEDVLRECSAADRVQQTVLPAPKRVFRSIDEIVQSVSRLGPIEAHYEYTNPESGAVEIVQIRYRDEGKKSFLVHHASPGGFVLGAPPKPWPLYNRKRLQDAPVVVVVEGEKCVHALHKIGIVATTSLSGSGNADKADWSPLAGKIVYLWPDKDAAGLKYAQTVAKMLEQLDPKPAVNQFDLKNVDLPEHGDAADLVDRGETSSDAIWHLLQDGSERIGDDLAKRLDDIKSGRYRNIAWPWRKLTWAAKSLFPGTITVICGDPSASKSFFLLQAMQWWHTNGHKVAMFELEEDRQHHLHRLLAILSGDWSLLDDEECRKHPDKVDQYHERHRAEIESFAPHLYAEPVGQLDYPKLQKWVEEKAATGCEIIGIDPITAVYTGDSRQIEDHRFIVDVSQIMRDCGSRLILVTHPRAVNGKRVANTQDDMAGGRAFSRHTQTVLWLNRHDPAKNFTVHGDLGAANIKCNRSVKIAKARNGPGHGLNVGFNLDSSVHFSEQGIVVKEKREDDEPAI